MQPNRLDQGGLIDRGRPLQFTFNGTAYLGYQGDTLASALLANGVKLVARSFKYGRPRGIVGFGAEEPNAIIQLGRGGETVPNLRATQVELYDGLEACSVSGWPSLDLDLTSLFGLVGRLLPPGFYYKTFMWPRRFWMAYEHFIRKAAGLGKAPDTADPDIYDKLHQHCDVLVVGGGVAGIQAARAAANAGARVIILDEQTQLGGMLLASHSEVNGMPALDWVAGQISELQGHARVTVLTRTTAFGYFDHNFVAAVERRTDHLGLSATSASRQRLHRIRARQVILASGAIERPLVFANNDLPGVMLASAVQAYLNRWAVAPGRRLLLVTNNDSAYQAALDWQTAGREVVAVLDTRPGSNGSLPKAAEAANIKVYRGYGLVEAKGGKAVAGARIASLSADGQSITGAIQELECDLIASSGGWSPVVHLSSHTGNKPRWDDEKGAFVPGNSLQNFLAVGASNGEWNLKACISQGYLAGQAAARAGGFDSVDLESPVVNIKETIESAQQAVFLLPHEMPTSRAPKQFVDQQLDVTAAAIELAAREGYQSIEHTKRYTALGFGTDQGKLGNINGMAILANALGKSIADTGTTVFRPAYTPTTFGAIAGRDVGELLDPERYTAMHRWHERHGAKWENVGQWKRPWYYPQAGETMLEAVNRECLAVRNSAGMLDASTLGKIDIQGPDAAEFITRIYSNSFLKLEPGRCRYGLMLKEDGMIFDDGVTACLGDNHYLMFTTTGGAAAVLSWLELWAQTEWPELQVYFTSVTDHWATTTVSGPKARQVLERLGTDIDLTPAEFKFMDWRAGTVAGLAARVFRISFTGELTYEINVPAHFGRYIWEAVYAAGKEFDITPYGTEAMHVLRAEKGFIICGQDTDGSMTPDDMNMGWAVNRNKAFSFIGKRSLERSDTTKGNRKQLVGLRTQDAATVLPEGAQIVNSLNETIPMRMQGHVTSSYFSPILGHSIALAVVKAGLSRMGDTVYCPLADGQTVAAKIVPSVFYDPSGERQNV